MESDKKSIPSPPPFEPLLTPEAAKKRVSRKKASKGPAVVFHNAKTEPQVPDAVADPKDELISQLQERLEYHGAIVDSMQELVDCARGSALILRSLFEYTEELAKHNTITEGLALALKIVADHADVATFGSNSGELCDSVGPDELIEVLETKLARLREKAKAGPDEHNRA